MEREREREAGENLGRWFPPASLSHSHLKKDTCDPRPNFESHPSREFPSAEANPTGFAVSTSNPRGEREQTRLIEKQKLNEARMTRTITATAAKKPSRNKIWPRISTEGT